MIRWRVLRVFQSQAPQNERNQWIRKPAEFPREWTDEGERESQCRGEWLGKNTELQRSDFAVVYLVGQQSPAVTGVPPGGRRDETEQGSGGTLRSQHQGFVTNLDTKADCEQVQQKEEYLKDRKDGVFAVGAGEVAEQKIALEPVHQDHDDRERCKCKFLETAGEKVSKNEGRVFCRGRKIQGDENDD